MTNLLALVHRPNPTACRIRSWRGYADGVGGSDTIGSVGDLHLGDLVILRGEPLPTRKLGGHRIDVVRFRDPADRGILAYLFFGRSMKLVPLGGIDDAGS